MPNGTSLDKGFICYTDSKLRLALCASLHVHTYFTRRMPVQNGWGTMPVLFAGAMRAWSTFPGYVTIWLRALPLLSVLGLSQLLTWHQSCPRLPSLP